jgi:hypothetical protein
MMRQLMRKLLHRYKTFLPVLKFNTQLATRIILLNTPLTYTLKPLNSLYSFRDLVYSVDECNSIDYGFGNNSTVPPSELPGLNKPSKKQKRKEDFDVATTRATELSIGGCNFIVTDGDVMISQNSDQPGVGSSTTTNSVWCADDLGNPAEAGIQGDLIRRAIDVKILRRDNTKDGPMRGVMFGLRSQINPDVEKAVCAVSAIQL